MALSLKDKILKNCGKVSITRLQNFFNLPEIAPLLTSPGKKGTIKVENGSFKWTKEAGANTLEDVNISVKSGELVAVVGHIGSGKSSLLSAMLNEMETVAGTVSINGSIGYVPQEAWLQNATVRDNITFGRKFDEQHYTKCVQSGQGRTQKSYTIYIKYLLQIVIDVPMI